ncbi:S-layer homology domain-containing protein [Oscillibacter valericigenes]|uniref:S-layer homology domain-containing protein n=1 Tax=Oscillibacter valericigenes TaxID=351091 RepID=UPI00195CC7BE|nr:S-layer homology domain-containing protein [Oscillibacter valericigenes]
MHSINGEQTNPDYYISESDHNKWDNDYGYYLVYNYGGGIGLQENESLPISDIAKITVTVDTVDGDRLDPVTIERGPYAGDFSVSTGAHEDSWLIELYINSENDYPEDPDPEPGDDYAITGIDKALVDSEDEKSAATAAGIDWADYDFPTDGKVIIPNEEGASVTLLYAITVTGKEGAAFTVTDKDATLVSGNVTADENDTFTGSIPDGGSITFYVSKTFDADDLENASEGDGTVLKNTATVAGDADPDEDEDTEETPAEEDVTTISRDVYVYLRVEGSGQNGELTEEDLATISEWGLEKSNPDDYYILGKLSDVELPEGIPTTGELTYEKYATYIKQAFTGNKFMAYNDNENVNGLLERIDSWEKLSWAYGAPGYNVEGNCLHLDGVLKLESSYDLTYDANGGTIDGSEKHIVNDITTKDPENYTLDTTINPEHADEGTKDVLFAGWTTDVDATGKIYSVEDAKNGSVPAAVEAVDLTETETVYALWSYDADDDGTPDINEIIVTPADITIYTGGDSYTGEIVDSKGDPVTSDGEDETQDYNGFPEPGFYITLPTALNDQLREDQEDSSLPVDLSNVLSFVYEQEQEDTEKHWTLQMYNPASGANNIAYKKFIYQLEPGAEQAPVRLLIKDAAGKEQPSDRFEFDVETLYQEYTMTIYGGENVETNEVQAVIEGDTYSVFVDTGNLTVRGVKGEDSTSAVVTEKPEELDKITAVAADDVTYYINDSAIPVRKDAEIHLLADELADTPQALTDAAEKAINGAIVDPEYDFMYLDLVDNSNGNAYVTLNKDGEADGEADTVTIHWPIPDDADPDGKFYVVHFDGLDREYDVDELDDLLNNPHNPDKVQVIAYMEDGEKELTVGEDSVSFETSTFSPFALVYEKTSTPTEQVTVTFKVDNGTWSDGSYRNIVYTINKGTTLASNSIAVPTGMQPESGYTGGSWDTTPNMTTPLNSNVTYTYSFTRSGGGSERDPYLRFDSNGGTEFDPIDGHGKPFSINVYHDEKYGDHIPTRPGYRFTGWYNTNTLRTRIDEDDILRVTGPKTVFAGWEETTVPSMLNGDDHYAYIQGYSDGTVRPNANITRAQVATIFFRLLDEDVRDDNLTTYNTFPDVDEDYWANTAISTMASLGVINGRNSGLFDPDAYITRAEFAAICARFDDSGVDGITTFTDTVGHWAEDEISRAAALGWIQGYSDGTFRPNQYITRAQAVTMINRVLCRLPEDTDDLLSGMNTWTDCHEDDWFYLAIQEATNSHDFVAKDRVYESWTDLNRAPDWSRYE